MKEENVDSEEQFVPESDCHSIENFLTSNSNSSLRLSGLKTG
jgi:hypothetical protein